MKRRSLTEKQKKDKKAVSGGSTPSPGSREIPKSSMRVFKVLWDLKKLGRSESSLHAWGKRLRHLARHVDLDDPESVKAFIATKKVSICYKEGLVQAYEHYVKFYGLNWSKPFYRREDRNPNVPTISQIERLIAFSSKKYQAILTLAKYGLRPVEIERLRIRDCGFKRGTVTVTTAKGGRARTIQLTIKDMLRVENFLQNHAEDLDKKPFPRSRAITDNYCKIRKRLAHKLNDNSYMKIRLYDFRHFYGTLLYHKTKDILYVKQQLGHRRIENTIIYTHLVKLQDSSYIVKAAKDMRQATELLEQGFDYVTDIEGAKLFRKPKSLSFSNLLFLFYNHTAIININVNGIALH